MPKKKPPVTIEIYSGSLEKSLSSPEISEIGKELNKIKPEDLSNRQEVEDALKSNNFKKQRRGSWLSKLLRTFRRKRNRTTTEPTQQTQINAGIQKSPSAQFYTAPPQEFLVEATNRNDDADASVECKDDNSEQLVEESNASKVNSSIKLYKRPNPVLPSSPRPSSAFVKELKRALSVEREQIMKDDDRPKYGNILDLNYPASTRRRSRPLSDGSCTSEHDLNEFDNIYEATWKPEANEQNMILKSSSQIMDEKDYATIPDIKPQPMERLHKFPKPKPPVNRKPSTRRGSHPEVIIRTKSSDSGPVSNRRSNAELEEVIKRLSDIPAPDAVPASICKPTPKKRTKFLNTSPTTQTDDELSEISKEENMTGTWFSFENNAGNSKNTEQNIIKSDLKIKEIQSIEVSEQSNAYIDERHINSILEEEHRQIIKPTIKRNQSFPAIKISKSKDTLFLLVDAINGDTSQIKKDDSKEDKQIKYYPLQRWKTLPTRFCFKSGKLVRKPADTPTIVVIPVKEGNLIDEDTDNKIAVVINAEIRPPSQNISTQTCPHLTEVSDENIRLKPHLSEAANDAIDAIEIEETSQNTPPNTPDQEPENYTSSSAIDNISQQTISNSAKFYGMATSSKVQHQSSETIESHPDFFGKKYVTNQNINANEYESSNYVLSKLRSNLKHVSREKNAYNRKESIESDVIGSDIALVSCVEESLLSQQTETPAYSKDAPTKSQRVSRKPPLSPKPLLLPRPDDFVRRVAMRKKRNTSSENKTTSSKHYLQSDNHHVSTYNDNNIRRSSLFPADITDEADDNEEALIIQRAKRRSKSIV